MNMMNELTYTEEEKRRLDNNGVLNYPKFPQDIYRANDFKWHSKKYPMFVFYPKHVFLRYQMKCYITECKNVIRELLNKQATKEEIESAFKVLQFNIEYSKKCERAFYEYLQIDMFVHHYYDEGDD